MSTDNNPGILQRLTEWIVYLVVALVLYALSMVAYFVVTGGGSTGVFVLWVLVTLVIIGSLK